MTDNIGSGYYWGYPFGGGDPTCGLHPTDYINTLKDYRILEGKIDALGVQLHRSVDVRRVGIENTTPFTLGIGICNFRNSREPPEIRFYLGPGEIKWLGINPPGSNPQFLWVQYVKTGQWSNTPHFLDYHSNYFAILAGDYKEPLSNLYNPMFKQDWEPWFFVQNYRQTTNQ
jgi:hypothetical protein